MPTEMLGRRIPRRPDHATGTQRPPGGAQELSGGPHGPATAVVGPRIAPRALWPRRADAHEPGDRWQFVLFCLIGGIGAAVNLAVYAGQVRLADIAPVIAATVAFCVAVMHNYLANRWLTFRRTRGGFVAQGSRFAVVSLIALALNLALLMLLLVVMESIAAQALAICLVAPVNFLGNKLWSFAGGR